MNKNMKNKIFFIIVLFLIFNNIPKQLQMPFISGILLNKLVFYPIFSGLVYTLYCQYKYKNIFINFERFYNFIFVYVGGICVSSFAAFYTYPYYDLVLNAPVIQIDKLSKVLSLLNSFGINTNEKIMTQLWMFVRAMKGVLFDTVYTFGVAYMIYCWYYNDWKKGFDILIKAVFASLAVVFFYSLIEVFYLAGNENAKNILEIITPYFHTIKSGYDWWPVLLQVGQLRSIFAEPSYYGIYFSFAMPILWFVLFTVNKKKYTFLMAFLIISYSFGVFLTQARTAVALFLGEIVILIFLIIYLKNKELIKRLVFLFGCCIFAFALSNIFISNYIQAQKVNNYFEKNLFSLASTNKRSNGARYSIMLADFKIGVNNPIVGVGAGLRSSYIPDYLPEMANDNKEIKMWISHQQEKGILKSGYPKLGEYTSRFAETGFVGLSLFLLPLFILLYKLIKIIKSKVIEVKNKLPYVFIAISLIGMFASGIGDSISITYCYWVLLGLGYAMCFGKDNNVELNGDTGDKQKH